jgi:outer membrane protein TolC
MKTVYYSLLASSSTIALFGVGVFSPLHAETLSIASDRPSTQLNQSLQLADGTLPKEMPKLPESFSPKTVPASPALQQPTFQSPTQSATPPPPATELPTKPANPVTVQPLNPQAPTINQNTMQDTVQVTPTSPAPEALYTPANPLLFPTTSKEVEIQPTFASLEPQRVERLRGIVQNEIQKNAAIAETRGLSPAEIRSLQDKNTLKSLDEVNQLFKPYQFSLPQFKSLRSIILEQADQQLRSSDLSKKRSEAERQLSTTSDSLTKQNIENEIRDLDTEINALNSERTDLIREFDLTIKSVPLTLNQTLELAERNNRDFEVSRLQVEQQKSNLREAQAALFPTLDLQSAVTRSQSANTTLSIKAAQAQAIANAGGDEQSARLVDSLSGGQIFRRDVADPNTTWDTSLQLNYNVYTSGGRAARLRAAEGAVKAAELALERVREQLRLDATGDYYDLQNADEQVRINKKAVENAQQSLKDTQLQEKVGLGTRFDVLRSKVQLANNKQALDSAKATQTIQRRQIAQRLSLPEHITVTSVDPVRRTGAWNKSLEETIVLAYKQRVELEEQLVQRDISESNRKQALSALGPQITLTASYDLLKIFEQPVSEPVGGYSLTATARWRLFDGGAARAQAEQQAINGKIAETRFTQSRNAIRFQVEQAYATMLANDKNIATTDTAVFQASEALRLAKLRFQAGVGTQTDVINAETDLTRAEGNRVTAILGYNRSIAQLRRSVSNVTPE